MYKANYKVILMFVVLVIAAIYILDNSLRSDNVVEVGGESYEFVESLPTESGVFERGSGEVDFDRMGIENPDRKSLDEYYEQRAYPGAPPVIPHELLSEKGIGGESCLQCHQNGGYVEQFEAYAPITPHTDLINCRQCHVPAKTNNLFKASDWQKIAHPDINNSVLPGSPPVIPHDLQMRENCLSCHAGPAAPEELLFDHPERVNCRQCHVLQDAPVRLRKRTFTQKQPEIEWEELSQ